MSEAIALVCKKCAYEFTLPAGMPLLPCPACSTPHSRPRAAAQALVDLRRAHQQRADCDFINAENNYQRVLNAHPDEAEALWGLALCRYGVEYVRDAKAGERLPVVHFLNRRPFTEDLDCRLAIARADADVRGEYMQDAAYIARIQQEVLAAEQRGDAWDVFLCYKASVPSSDDPGAHTREFDCAQELYIALRDAGYSVFFAHQTLRRAAGANYEAQIFHALHSAKVMLVITADPAHLRTPWVHSEWSRYLERIDDHQDCRLIPLLYDGCDPYALPDEFLRRSIQGLHMGTITALDDLRRALQERVRQTAVPTPTPPVAPETSRTMLRISMALEDGEWDKAERLAAALIDDAPDCAEAHLSMLLARRKEASLDVLVAEDTDFTKEVCWKRAWRFAGADLRQQMTECVERIEAAIRAAEEETRRIAEEKARMEAEEAARRAAEEKARMEAEEAAKRAAEENARREAEEAAQRAAEEKARREAEEAAQRAAEEKARREEEAAARRAAEEKVRRKLEEAARRDAEAKARREAEEAARRTAAKKARREAAKAQHTTIENASAAPRSTSRSEAALTEDAERLREAMRLAHDRIGVRNSKNHSISVTHASTTPSIAAGAFHTISLRADGSVVAVGSNGYGQCDVRSWKGITAIAAGAYHTIGLQEDGSVVSVGWNNFDQRRFRHWQDIVAIAGGVHHTVGLQVDGSVVAVGMNQFGQLNVIGWKNIIAITAGAFHTVGLHADGSVVAVGRNVEGQCKISGWTDVVAISAGTFHTVGLRADGSVVSIGSNDSAQCNVSDWTDIVAIAAGESHTVGLREDGSVIAVGSNEYVQCDVGGWKNIVAIAAGNRHTVGLRADGSVVATGSNNLGQCSVSNWRFSTLPK